ncbi:MAG: NYN domain-containing protein [Patescibacteria group bacterium]|nr:NYN domain-containing protein [Patescibacteria group bacterium]
MNLGTSKDIYNRKGRLVYKGWRLDYKKFYQYLKDKYRADKVFYFIGYIRKNERLYKELNSYGYSLVFKPTTRDGIGKPKGNVDAELVLYASSLEYDNYDKSVIVSGDGDFYCLLKFLKKRKKLLKIIVPNKKSASSLLADFEECKVFLEREKEKLSK